MKFQADREVLSDAVSFLVRLLSPRPQLPQLSGVMIEATGNEVQLSIFDYEVAARVKIAAAVDLPGKVLVQARLLSEILSKLPVSSVAIQLDESRLQVNSGSSKFSLSSMSTTDYPDIPPFPTPTGKVSASEFTNGVSKVAVAASREEITPVLTAVMITASAKELTMVSTDRFRVAVKVLPWNGKSVEREVLIPARVLSEISKTFSHDNELELGFGDGEKDMIGFSSGNKSVSTATIKGKYPAVLQLLPDETATFAILSRQDLLDATRRVALVVDREKPLRYKFSESELSLESIGSDVADASEQISCSMKGEETLVSPKASIFDRRLDGPRCRKCKNWIYGEPKQPK